MIRTVLFSFLFIGLIAPSQANPPPKMEVGLGMGGQYIGDYRGSQEMQSAVIPIPLIIYRGKVFRAEGSAIKGRFFSSKHFELNMSAEAALNGGSEDNSLRQGMPPLDSAFELGPSLNLNLTGEDFREGFSLRFPLRAIYTLSTEKTSYIGYIFNPKLTWRKPNIWGGFRVSANVGALWASRQYHDYFYSVDAAYVTPERPFYQADGGYSGAYFKTSIARRRGSIFYGFSLRYDYLGGTVYEDSPLVETDDHFAVSLGFGWFFWRSKN